MTSAKNTIHQKEKHFKHYLFEFLMLFLAVTLGFFVENFREERVERSREKQFIRSFTEDLKKDVFELDSLIGKRVQRKVWMDSLTLLLNSPDLGNHGSDVYLYARYLPRPYLFISNDATIQQLNTKVQQLEATNRQQSSMVQQQKDALQQRDSTINQQQGEMTRFQLQIKQLGTF